MSEATPFCAGFRHGSNTSPGRSDVIVYQDPSSDFTDDAVVFGVELDEEKSRLFLSRIWNMESWDVLSSVSVEGTHAAFSAPFGGSHEMTGQFTNGIIDYGNSTSYTRYVNAYAHVPIPGNRVSGQAAYTEYINVIPDPGDPPTTDYNYTLTNSPYAFPALSCYAIVDNLGGSATESLDTPIKASESGAEVGHLYLTIGFVGEHTTNDSQTYIDVLKIWLKPDGTVKVFITVFWFITFASEISFALTNSTATTATTPYSSLGAYEASNDVDIDLFGVTVPAKVWGLAPFGAGDIPSLSSFSFVHKINTSSQYTYPVDE